MSEHEHPHAQQPNEHTGWTADVYEHIGLALNTPLEPLAHDDLGPGAGYLVNPHDRYVALELYPRTNVLKLGTPDVAVELGNITPPRTQPGGVIFEHTTPEQHTSLTITASGGVYFSIEPRDDTLHALELDTTAPTPSIEPTTHPDPTAPAGTDSRASEKVAGGAAQSLDQSLTDDERKQERVTLQGRAGRDPHIRTTPNGKTVAQFPLGVKDEENNTTWHTVVAFDKRARKLQEGVKKGDAVQVIGYKHLKELKGKDGKPRTVEEIYAVVVKPR